LGVRCWIGSDWVDDQSDYFSSSNSWLSPEERQRLQKLEEQARQKREENRGKVSITLDLAGRQVVQHEREVVDMRKEAELAGAIGTSGMTAASASSAGSSAPPTRARGTFANPFLMVEAPKFCAKEERDSSVITAPKGQKAKAAQAKAVYVSNNCAVVNRLYGAATLTQLRYWYREHKMRVQHEYFTEDS
jgi:hypothetical protein